MHKSELKSNGLHGSLLTELQRQSSWLRTMRRIVLLCCAGMLMLLVLLLQGCGTTSKLQAEPPQPVLMPAIQSSPPTVPWQQQAATLLNEFREMLTSVTQTSR